MFFKRIKALEKQVEELKKEIENLRKGIVAESANEKVRMSQIVDEWLNGAKQ